MVCFSFILFWSFLFINVVIIQRSSCDLINVQKKLKPDESSSFRDKITSFTEKGQEAIDDLRCQEKWSRFRNLCYSLSNRMSTVAQANNTCNGSHLNYSRLMYIKNPFEIFYAAHVLTENNLNELLLEIDPDLMKGGKIVNMLSSNDYIQWDKTNGDIADEKINRESTTVSGTEIDDNNKKYYKKFENIANIREPCHQINWNVINEESNVLILRIESELNQSICSLSNADYTSAYAHLCQYVLDRCLNNIACGEHGHCANINSETGYNCSCSFLYAGVHCEKYSHTDIQVIIAIIACFIIGVFVIYSTPRQLICGIINLCRQQPITAPAPQPTPVDNDHDYALPIQNEPRIEWPPERTNYEFELKKEEQHLRNIFLIFLTIASFLFFFKLPPIHYIKLPQLNHTNLPKVNSPVDNNIHTIGQYRRYTIFNIDNFIFLSISGLLVFIFSFLNRKEKRNDNEDDDRSGLVEPIKLLRINDRFETTALIVIQMFEILEVLEETLVDIDESAQYGVFAQIFKRVFFVILIGLRYYPTLASLEFQNSFVRLLVVIYFIGSMVYKTLRESSGIHWLLFLMKLQSTPEDSYIDLRSWSFLHGSIRNILHYSFIGYICAELIMRLLYDSIYIMVWKRGRKLSEIPHRTIEQYSFKVDRQNRRFLRNVKETKNPNSNQQGRWNWNRIRESVTSIYEWDNKFHYTTIVICTYTVAYIFLLHLTGTVILLYNTQTNNYIRYIKDIFQVMLHIEIKEGSYQIEVIISAIITMIIYGIQLFLSIKNFRKSMGDLYTKFSDTPELGKKLKKRQIIRKSTQYPSYLLLYLLGGFFICFHLILLFTVTIKRAIFPGIRSSKNQATARYILPIIVLYGLQKVIILLLHKIFDHFDQRDENNLNLKLNILDSILLYLKLISCAFIGIIASVIRLIFSFLVNIIFMPRIDYSYLVEPLKGLDSAHESFQAFLRLEILCVYSFILDFSTSLQEAPQANIPPNESTAVQYDGDEYHDPENNEELQADSQSVNEIHGDNSDAQTTTSQRTSRRDYEPALLNIRLNDDENVSAGLLSNEASNGEP